MLPSGNYIRVFTIDEHPDREKVFYHLIYHDRDEMLPVEVFSDKLSVEEFERRASLIYDEDFLINYCRSKNYFFLANGERVVHEEGFTEDVTFRD